MPASLRDLLLSIKVKVDKSAVAETDKEFAHAAKSAEKFEAATAEALRPLKKLGAQLDANIKKAQDYAKALLPAAVLSTPRTAGAPEAPSNRRAREAREMFQGPAAPETSAHDLAMLPEGALPARPEAPGDRRAREMRDAFGLSHRPLAPRPNQSLAAPDVSAFMVPEATPDFRTGPQKAVAKGIEAIRTASQTALSTAGGYVDRFNAKFDGTVRAIFNARTAMAGFAVVVAGAAIGRFFNDVIEAGGALHDMAQRTRVSVETLQVWRGIATDAGVDANSLEGVFRKLNKSMAAAARGGKLQAASFKELGVEVKNSDGSLRPIEEVLIDTGAALAGMEDDAKATAIATQLLGPAGMGLVPAFNEGADAIRKLSIEMKENVALNAAEAAALDDVGDALTRGEKKWTALKTRAIVALLPLLTTMANAFEAVSKWVLRMAKETAILQTILLAITGGALFRLVTLLGAWVTSAGGARAALAVLGQGLRTVAAFAWEFILPMLLIEDFLTFLKGGKSVFGDAMNAIFGDGGADEKRKQLLAFFKDIGAAASSLATPLAAIAGSELFKGVAKLALEGILAVLNAIGLALADNTERAEKLAASLGANLGMTKADTQAVLDAGRPEDLGGAKRDAPEQKGFAQKAAELFFGDPSKGAASQADAARNAAIAARMRQETAPHAGGLIGPVGLPTAPPAAKAVTLTDNRKIEVTVGGNATPAATGRATAGAIDATLTKDRRQTLNAL